LGLIENYFGGKDMEKSLIFWLNTIINWRDHGMGRIQADRIMAAEGYCRKDNGLFIGKTSTYKTFELAWEESDCLPCFQKQQ
jgi:hypothetical protein